MTTRFHIPISCITLLLNLFFLQVHAQQRSVADTIDFILQHEKQPSKRCDALFALGSYYFNIGDSESALVAMTRSKSEAEKHNYDKGSYDAYAILGAISIKGGQMDKARDLAEECLQLANRNHSEYGANRGNYLLAFMYLFQNNLDSVIAIGRRAVEKQHEVYDSINLPRFEALLGNAYMGKGNFRQANMHYLRALDIAERTNNEQLQVICIGNIALINDELVNYREALKYQRKAEYLAKKNNQLHGLAGTYNNMGGLYRHLAMLDSALFFFKKSLPLYQDFGLPTDIAMVHSNLGACLIELNQPDSGLHYLLLAKKEYTALKDTINNANNSLMLGAAWRLFGQTRKERAYFHLAEKELIHCQTVAEKLQLEDLKMKCYYQQAVLYEAMGNESKGFHYLKLYSLMNDSIRSQQFTRQIAEMQTKYETEKKELEINKLNAEKLLGNERITRQKILNYSLLSMAGLILISGSVVFRNNQKKRIAERQISILEKQNAIESMRSKIASDVHDEMGANLTRLGLNAQQLLQNTAIPEKEKQLAEKMSNQSKEIITGMREIIWASNPANDNLKSMLGFMRQYIDRFFDGTQIRPVVNFPQDVGEVTLHPEVRRNLFLILKESLNNSVKYSGSDRIDIDFYTENEKFELKVKDYGKGIDESNKDNFSNGMHNMQMRAEQIQSLFKLISTPGQGVQIIVEGKLY